MKNSLDEFCFLENSILNRREFIVAALMAIAKPAWPSEVPDWMKQVEVPQINIEPFVEFSATPEKNSFSAAVESLINDAESAFSKVQNTQERKTIIRQMVRAILQSYHQSQSLPLKNSIQNPDHLFSKSQDAINRQLLPYQHYLSLHTEDEYYFLSAKPLKKSQFSISYKGNNILEDIYLCDVQTLFSEKGFFKSDEEINKELSILAFETGDVAIAFKDQIDNALKSNIKIFKQVADEYAGVPLESPEMANDFSQTILRHEAMHKALKTFSPLIAGIGSAYMTIKNDKKIDMGRYQINLKGWRLTAPNIQELIATGANFIQAGPSAPFHALNAFLPSDSERQNLADFIFNLELRHSPYLNQANPQPSKKGIYKDQLKMLLSFPPAEWRRIGEAMVKLGLRLGGLS